MSQIKSTLERGAGIDKFIHNTFQICNTKKSMWMLEGTGGDTGIPANYMHTSNIMFLEVTSRLYLGKDKGYMPTAYVIGANTHYVQDYWTDADGNPVFDKLSKEAAAAKGLEYRPGLLAIYGKEGLREEEARSKRKGICFEKGRLNLSKYGDDPVLRAFVNEHEQNKNAPNASENNDPTRLKIFMFEPLIKENKAAKSKEVENFDTDLEALNFVGKLRTKKGDSYIYDEDKMDAVLTILQEGVGLEKGEQIQKFKIIRNAAASNGTRFMELINEVMNEVRVEIGTAVTLDVLEYGATEATLVSDGKKRSLISYPTGTKKEDAVQNLILYFLGSAEGRSNYKDLKRQSESAKIKALDKKK